MNFIIHLKKITSKHYSIPKKNTALIECESQLLHNPHNVDALLPYSQWYFSQGRRDEAMAIAKKIIEIDPNFHKAHDFLSQQTTQHDNNQQLPENIKTLEDIGMNFLKSQQLDRALDAFKKIITLDPKHAAAHRYLSDIYTDRQQFQEAIHHLNRLAMQFPNDDRILFNLAVACFNANDLNRAKSNLKAAHNICTDADLLSEIQTFLDHINDQLS